MSKTRRVAAGQSTSRKEKRDSSKAVHMGRVYRQARKLSNALLRTRLADLVEGVEYL